MPLPNPEEPLSVLEQRTFGVDARRHPVTGFIIERGSGALPEKEQARVVHVQTARQMVYGEARARLIAGGIAPDQAAEVARTESLAVARSMASKLDVFESVGGVSVKPAAA